MARLALFFSISILLGFCRVGSSQSLVSLDDPTFGSDSITLDTRTGLEWLDTRFSVEMTLDDILLETAPGGQFESFELADNIQVGQLITSAGLDADSFSFPIGSSGFELAENFANLVGTFEVDGFSTVSAMHGPLLTQGPAFERTFIFVGSINEVPHYNFSFAASNPNNPSQFRGFWLVRPASIPEPSSGFLIVLSSLTMISFKRVRISPGR